MKIATTFLVFFLYVNCYGKIKDNSNIVVEHKNDSTIIYVNSKTINLGICNIVPIIKQNTVEKKMFQVLYFANDTILLLETEDPDFGNRSELTGYNISNNNIQKMIFFNDVNHKSEPSDALVVFNNFVFIDKVNNIYYCSLQALGENNKYYSYVEKYYFNNHKFIYKGSKKYINLDSKKILLDNW